MNSQEPGISWMVHSHEHRERSMDWYWALGVLALVGAGLSIFFGNLLLALIIVIGGGCIGVLAARGPREHSVKIDQRGVSLDGTLYPYRSIHSFWVEDPRELPPGQEAPRLLVSTSGVLAPQLVIPLENIARATSVRSYLRRYAQEEHQEPHLGERLAELFGL